VHVFITIDTETSIPPPAPDIDFDHLVSRGIWGECDEGNFGTRYMARIFEEYGLKAVFFVEALHASVFGPGHLDETVGVVQSHGQEAQLHVHTEWMAHAPAQLFDGRTGVNIADFSTAEQADILAAGKNNLVEAGVSDVTAFRAGNYGANDNTLPALARNGIHFDASYNASFVGDPCGISWPNRMTGPEKMGEMVEVPVSWFHDGPGHIRALQLCACSLSEMRHVLTGMAESGARAASIVLHSSELLSRDKSRVEKIVRSRFLGLCKFLADNRETFQTLGFNDVAAWRTEELGKNPPAVRSAVTRTAFRMAEQAAGNFLYQRGRAA
jgi:hypothetical protein